MGKATKIWIIVAAVLLIGGLTVCFTSASVNGNGFTELCTVKYQTTNHKITDSFDSIAFDTKTSDIRFLPADDGQCKVVCYEEENIRHTVKVESGTLTVTAVDTREWYDHVGINFNTAKITVYLPLGEYNSLNIRNSTGDIEICQELEFDNFDIRASTGDITVENITADEMSLSVSTGHIDAKNITCDGSLTVTVSTGKSLLRDITCKTFTTEGNTGDLTMTNVVASDSFNIIRTTGDVNFIGCDAAAVFIDTDTGDVSGTFLTGKSFVTETSTGDISLPDSSGGECRIKTSTGDVNIDIK